MVYVFVSCAKACIRQLKFVGHIIRKNDLENLCELKINRKKGAWMTKKEPFSKIISLALPEICGIQCATDKNGETCFVEARNGHDTERFRLDSDSENIYLAHILKHKQYKKGRTRQKNSVEPGNPSKMKSSSLLKGCP